MARLNATPKTYQQAVEVLGNRDSVKLGNNTWIERIDPSTIGVRLHYTHIVQFHIDGRITLHTQSTPGGRTFRTVTTKDRINEFITGRVYQKNYDWFYVGHDSTGALDWNHPQPFVESMNVGPEDTTEKPIGFMFAFAQGHKVLCLDCASRRTTYAGTDIVTGSKLTPLFAVNLAQYQQHCADPACGVSVNPNAHPKFPELFDGR